MADQPFAEGTIVKFKGYAEDVEGAILQPGERVKVRTVNADGGMIVDQLDADGNVRTDVDVNETLFADEVEALEDDVDADAPAEAEAEVEAEAEAPAPKSKGKDKGGIKPAAKTLKSAKDIGTTKGEVATQSAADVTEEVGPRSQMVRQAMESVSDTGSASDGASALLAAKALVNRVDETYYTLGGVLAYIKEEGVYKSLGYDGKRGFADYCKTELGTDYRKAQYLIDVFEKVQAAGLNEKRLAEIGWSKAVQIVRVGDVSLEKLSEDFDSLVDYAKANSRDDLISHIQKNYEVNTRPNSGGSSDTKVTVSTFIFKLAADAAVSAERALGTAKSLAGSEDLSDAFKYICDDWSMMTEGTNMDLETAMAVIEHRFNVKLVAEAVEAEAVQIDEATDAGETQDEEVPA